DIAAGAITHAVSHASAAISPQQPPPRESWALSFTFNHGCGAPDRATRYGETRAARQAATISSAPSETAAGFGENTRRTKRLLQAPLMVVPFGRWGIGR